MFARRHLLGIFGLAALIAGLFVFGANREFSTNWARWVFGPLLWFIGFGMVVAWITEKISRTAREEQEKRNKQRLEGRGKAA